jgi:hypothetical protein
MSDFEVGARIKRVEPAAPAISGRLSGIRFEPPPKVWFEDAHLEDVDFSRLKIDFFVAADSTFDRCDFTRSAIAGSLSGAPGRAVFRDCVFDRANLRKAAPGNSRFERCSFDHARLDGWSSWSAEFVDCRFAGPLRKIEFRGISPYEAAAQRRTATIDAAGSGDRGRNEFRGNDFREADLEQVEFIDGIDLDAQRLPDGPDYLRVDVRPETIDRVVAAAEHSLPPDQREKFLFLVQRWLRGRHAGQAEVFRKRTDDFLFKTYIELLERLGDKRAH